MNDFDRLPCICCGKLTFNLSLNMRSVELGDPHGEIIGTCTECLIKLEKIFEDDKFRLFCKENNYGLGATFDAAYNIVRGA